MLGRWVGTDGVQQPCVGLREGVAQTFGLSVQAMERRYTALAEDQGRLAADKEKLAAEKGQLEQVGDYAPFLDKLRCSILR
jgi:hypothetical protein